MGTWQAVSVVAVDQGRGKAGDRGDGKKWIDLRDNQGLKSTGRGDRLSMGMRERKGSLSKTRFLFCKAGCYGRLRRWDRQTGRGPGVVEKL